MVGASDAGTGGAVYIFSTTDGWTTHTEIKLTASDAAAGDDFGRGGLAIVGDTVFVGARYDDDAAFNSGAVYVFRTSDGGATYAEVAKLTQADATGYDNFGFSLAIDGDTLVIGAFGHSAGHIGAAYIFRTSDSGATYDQVAKLTAADGAANDAFGGSVAIDGDTIVVGACCDDDGGSNSGSAYVFEDDSGWFGAGWFGSSSQKSNGGGVADDDKMMTLVVLAALLGLSLAIAAGLFALRQQQQLAAKKPRAPRTFTVTAVQSV